MRLYRHFRTLLHHRKFKAPAVTWREHMTLRDRAKRLFKPDQYKAVHQRLRQMLYQPASTLDMLLPDRVYLVEVVVDGERAQRTARGVSIAVYDHGYQGVHHGNFCPDGVRYRDGVFYYMLHDGRLGKVSLTEPGPYLASLKRLTAYRPDWQLN